MTIQIDTGVQLIIEKSKFSKKQLSSLTENLRSAYGMSLRSAAREVIEPPKKVERKVKVIKKGK
jgi:stalled ribosome rescue protein Dom34